MAKKKTPPKDTEWARANNDAMQNDDELMEELFDEAFLNDYSPPSKKEIAEENQMLHKRWQEFQMAADYITSAYSQLPQVEKIVLFGSVAVPLKKEIPRFRKFRRYGVKLWHECKDVDIAVWVNDLSTLNKLRKIRSQQMNPLWHDKNIGIAHHQVEIFVLDSKTDRYVGRLCCFNTCPKKGKRECLVEGCGEPKFLQQIEDFKFNPDSLHPDKSRVLYDRKKAYHHENSLDEELPF